MSILPDWIKQGYLRLAEPVAGWLVRKNVHPNTITAVGTTCAVVAGGIYASGHISVAGWFFGLTAICDVLDGMVARRTGQVSRFGAFLDSTLDRIADGAILGGLAIFFATHPGQQSAVMVTVCIAGLIGSFLTSYTRARAEGLGLDAKVGILQRPERIVLLSAPQALFGLALNGLVLSAIVFILAVTSWVTVVQRVLFVHRQTDLRKGAEVLQVPAGNPTWLQRRRDLRRAAAKGE